MVNVEQGQRANNSNGGGGGKKRNRNKKNRNKSQRQQNDVTDDDSAAGEPGNVADETTTSNKRLVDNLRLEMESRPFMISCAQVREAERIYYSNKSAAAAGPKSQDFDDDDELMKQQQCGGKSEEAAECAAEGPKCSLAAEIARARQHIKNSLECVDGLAAMTGSGGDKDLLSKLNGLEIENKSLKKVTDDLSKLVVKLESRVAKLEEEKGSKSAPPPATKEEEDEDVDLFASDSEEDDEEKARITAERLKAYHEKKAKKPAVIAKTSVLLDIKPWDDETDMDAMLKAAKSIEKDGLLWGASKLVPVGYGINKLQLMCVVEDDKVSIEELCEEIAKFEDHVQSADVASMSKI